MPLIFIWNLSDSSLHQHPSFSLSSCTQLRQWRGRLKTMGGLRGPVKEEGGWGGVAAHARRQKEGGGEEGKVRQVGDQAFLILHVGLLVHLHGYGEPHTLTHTQHPQHGQSGSCLSLHSPLHHYRQLEPIPQQWGCVPRSRPAPACMYAYLCAYLKFKVFPFFAPPPPHPHTHSLFTHRLLVFLHTCTCGHNGTGWGSLEWGPLREAPPPGPDQYMRSHASITESLLSQGLGAYDTHCVLCVWGPVCSRAFTPVVFILLSF